MTNVFDRLTGQEAIADDLRAAARAARVLAQQLDAGSSEGLFVPDDEIPGVDAGWSRASMTHSWLFTGPPGSGRSVAATCFAAALQCQSPESANVGCGECRACVTVMAKTHADVRHVVPEGLSLAVGAMRDIVQAAARRPGTGRWQIVIVEDADRLTEQAANALLKVVEEPPPRTVFLLCAPSVDPEDISVTLRSRCRHVALVSPTPAAIERVLIERDGLDPEQARWAASVCGGHIGRARRLATDPDARSQREKALSLARAASRDSTAYAAAEELVRSAETAAKAISAELDEAETEEMKTALGAGGTGKGTARMPRGSAGALKELEKRQKSRATRVGRDVLDRALVDLAALFRDALVVGVGAKVTAMHPDKSDDISIPLAGYARPEQLLSCVEAVLDCREALDMNVKPKFAVDDMVARIGLALKRKVDA
ncbi:DNA polymerase III subunit delta' [Gordonia rubripertincta]|uniref:DNA polymerase III subunit delta n=2 Tax=Gordonia rubripertincta TaxID=36822 RepID=A0AAW6R9U7_GORRU|nr:DNA polymerase III subunit delta' [Gordonia rubripertincta]MDG6780943.1 DNA polymerase III subunit delta' [Gordonia rubripertincta]NKY63379.1 DNA polymerase III subunit delta' [Gordonia rubripertincta]QMU22245.1 DNA polymerase III subunit delta' [Gordonia rubripertincta]TSD94327.1 DNA polymerase III subunit delta' [Gordonia rubripertincta]GAB87783.1 DNA polymerase III delta' subunit [Gordonia rubripertincta NBRC 101908]